VYSKARQNSAIQPVVGNDLVVNGLINNKDRYQLNKNVLLEKEKG